MAAVEAAQKLYAARGAGDVATVMSLLSDDIIMYVWNASSPGGVKAGVPMSGVWKNKDGVGQYFKALHESIDVIQFDLRSFHGAGNEVFVKVCVEAKAKATGKTFKTDMLQNWTMNDAGLFSRFVEYCDTDAVVKAHQAD